MENFQIDQIFSLIGVRFEKANPRIGIGANSRKRSNIDMFFEIIRIENKYASLISELTRMIGRGIEKCGKRNVYVYD